MGSALEGWQHWASSQHLVNGSAGQVAPNGSASCPSKKLRVNLPAELPTTSTVVLAAACCKRKSPTSCCTLVPQLSPWLRRFRHSGPSFCPYTGRNRRNCEARGAGYH